MIKKPVATTALALLMSLTMQSSESLIQASPKRHATTTLPSLVMDTDFALPYSSFEVAARPQDQRPVNSRHSASDWLHNVLSLPKSSVLRDIRNPVVSIAAWSALVSVAHKMLASSSSQFLNRLANSMCIGSTPHSFLVRSLGLLLVFRTNSAYQRFYEGRKIWENILSHSRSLSRFLNLYSNEIGLERKRRILNLVAAFPYLLRHHIRPGCLCEEVSGVDSKNKLLLHEPSVQVDYATAPQKECWVDRRNLPWCLLERGALKKVAAARNRPVWVCDRVSREMMDIPYGPNFSSRERLVLLKQVEQLTNTVGQCERIHQTAVPLNYARHSLRSLSLWLITLPFAMVKDLGLLTGPVMGAVAWLLFGVYQIGYSIEDPFQGSLQLSSLCDAIRRDVIGESGARETAYQLEDPMQLPNDEAVSSLLDYVAKPKTALKQPVPVGGTWDEIMGKEP